MGETLLTGSALAAFLAGTVAFFAPCCAFVMLPTYLASVAGASRWRTAALTAVFVGGVATVVWPLTVGAAGLSQLIAANHEAMFVAGGALMLLVGAATLAGWMWHRAPAAGGGDPSGLLGIYLMGVFAGAATACCAPVLAGAVTIAGVSGSWWAGALLGAFYLLGLVSPLLLSALGLGRLRERLRDPRLALRVAGRTIHTTAARLLGGAMFVGLGALLIALALSGESRSAPQAQKAFGRWLAARASDLAGALPPVVGWALAVGLAAGVALAALRALRATPGPPPRPRRSDALMSHRIDRNAARRAERQRRQAQARQAQARQRLMRRAGYAGVALLAAALVTLAVVLGGGGGASVDRAASAAGAGPAVGSRAPDFRLTDVVANRPVGLWSLAGRKTLLFFSEGVGCQACMVQIADLQKTRALAAAGIRLVSVTTDAPGDLAQAAREYGIDTPLLADPTTSMSSAYGMLGHGGMEHPAQDGHAFMLIDAHGTVRWHRAYQPMYVKPGQLLADMGAAR